MDTRADLLSQLKQASAYTGALPSLATRESFMNSKRLGVRHVAPPQGLVETHALSTPEQVMAKLDANPDDGAAKSLPRSCDQAVRNEAKIQLQKLQRQLSEFAQHQALGEVTKLSAQTSTCLISTRLISTRLLCQVSVGASLKGLGMKMTAAIKSGALEEQATLLQQANEMVMPLVDKMHIDTSDIPDFAEFKDNCLKV